MNRKATNATRTANATKSDAIGVPAEVFDLRYSIEVTPKRWTHGVTFENTLMEHLKSRKRHSKEYRKHAVELLLTGKTLRELAPDIGVSCMTLQRWKEEYLIELSQQPADVANLPPLKMQEELVRLRKENAKLKLHQEILKKALGILSDPPPNGMP
jgi:transposase-like protein